MSLAAASGSESAQPPPSVPQETRGFDEHSFSTFRLRTKEDAPDYRYMPDANLGVVHISEVRYSTSALCTYLRFLSISLLFHSGSPTPSHLFIFIHQVRSADHSPSSRIASLQSEIHYPRCHSTRALACSRGTLVHAPQALTCCSR